MKGLGFEPPATLPGFAAGPLRLTKVQQRVELKVDEEGTEAAAATAAVATRSTAERFVRVAADKPFMFALRDSASGLIIVTGYVANPVAAARAAPPRHGRVMQPSPGHGGFAIPLHCLTARRALAGGARGNAVAPRRFPVRAHALPSLPPPDPPAANRV